MGFYGGKWGITEEFSDWVQIGNSTARSRFQEDFPGKNFLPADRFVWISILHEPNTSRLRDYAIMLHDTVGRPMEILLVEDSLVFARLAIAALNKGKIQHRLTWLTDGADAWEFLARHGAYTHAPRPDLLLLDLKLPGLEGTELLARLRSDCDLQNLPVIVMTGEGEATIVKDLAVEAFLTKPLEFESFIKIVQQLSQYWQADMLVPASQSVV